jgi:predicted dehydrogenase
MVHSHPQWLRAREIVRSGEIGELRTMLGAFSYFNRDPKNIRNNPEIGGGGLMDIGCYPITMSRFIYGTEPLRATGVMELDPEMGTDRLTSAILHFASGQSVFTCSTQAVPYQTFQILGTKGRIELEIPFNAPPDRPTRLFVDTGADLFGGGKRMEEFAVCDQYTIQGDLFSRAIREGGEVPTPLEDSIANMQVIEAVSRSAQSGCWERVI